MIRGRVGSRAREVFIFGLGLALLEFFVAAQAFKLWVVDRYYFPCIFALALSMGVALSAATEQVRFGKWRLALSSLLLLVLVSFSVAGLHDQFRWNDARWSLVQEALDRGAWPSTVQGGYEVNGWLAYDDLLNRRRPPRCIGRCRCRGGFFCVHDSYRIGMNLVPGYSPIKSIQPRYWLANGPPVTLSVRSIY